MRAASPFRYMSLYCEPVTDSCHTHYLSADPLNLKNSSSWLLKLSLPNQW